MLINLLQSADEAFFRQKNSCFQEKSKMKSPAISRNLSKITKNDMIEEEKTKNETAERLYTGLVTLFSANLVMTNILSMKLFNVPFFNISLPIGDLSYPLSFLMTDIISEIWGKKRANFAVCLGFFVNIFLLVANYLAVSLPPSDEWVLEGFETMLESQKAYASIFSTSSVLIFASMLAYVSSQFVDVSIFHLLKKLCKGRHLWLRNNVATLTAQFLDTFLFHWIFLYIGLNLSIDTCLQISIYSYLGRIIFALLDTPFCYLAVYGIKKKLKML